jgi:hypothetical protein
MIKPINLLSHIFLAAFVLASSSFSYAYSHCTIEFNYQDGWLGGDAAYSVPLSETKSLWLFGDTFVNPQNNDSRIGATIIGNSVALSNCVDNKFDVQYFWRKSLSGKPKAYMPDKGNYIKYWPQTGFYYKDKVYVFWRAIKTIAAKEGPFNFQGVDTLLTTIKPSKINTPNKSISQIQSLNPGTDFSPGIAFVIQEPYVYLFGVLDNNKSHAIILQRILLKNLNHLTNSLQTLTNSGWKNHVGFQKAKIIVPTAANEMSVLYHDETQLWRMIYSVFPGPIMQRTSKSLSGPWSEPKQIYVPPLKYKDEFCYAAKSHEQYKSKNGEPVITYVCNSFDFNTLVNTLDLYQPKLVPDL